MSNRFLARFSGVALALVAPEAQAAFEMSLHRAEADLAVVEQRLDAEPVAYVQDDFWPAADSWMARYRPYVVKDGILQIPVKGVLLNDFPFALGDWATGYIYIQKAFERGMADPEVKGIALICHSPGGEVAGNFDLVDRLYSLQQEAGAKPVRAFAHEYAYSAAYSIASVASKGIAISRTGGVGSVGVVTSHTDISEAMAERGCKITFIFAGKHKVDGNPYEALSAEVKARIQSRIDAIYDVFVSTVARNRPALSEEAVRKSEALTFTAAEAVSNGFADSIGSLDDAVAAFAADLNPGDDQMADQATTGAVDQAAHDAAVTAAREEGRQTGLKEGASAERARIVGILGSDVAKDRPVAAQAAALETDMSLEQASAFLAKMPKEAAPEPAASTGADASTPGGGTNRFTEAMNGSEHPNVGANGSQDENATDDGSADVALARQYGLAGFAPAASK